VSNWRMAKGLVKGLIKCNKCNGHYPADEFCKEEDLCLYCVFPASSKVQPAPMTRDYGFPKNETRERELLDHLDEIPEVQSESAERAQNEYKNRKVYK